IAASYVAYRGSGEYRADAFGLWERCSPVRAARCASFALDFNRPSGRRTDRGGAECKVSGAESETFHDTLRHHLRNGQKDCPIRDERTKAYRSMCFSLRSLCSEIDLLR